LLLVSLTQQAQTINISREHNSIGAACIHFAFSAEIIDGRQNLRALRWDIST